MKCDVPTQMPPSESHKHGVLSDENAAAGDKNPFHSATRCPMHVNQAMDCTEWIVPKPATSKVEKGEVI